MIYDTVIIGAGPAGLSAAIYAARSGAKTLLVDALYTGGQMTKIEKIDNYPGFSDGVDGFTLAAYMEKQAQRFGVHQKNARAMELDVESSPKRVIFDDGEAETSTVILATGSRPNLLGLPNEERLTGSGISYCATCDAAFFKNASVAIVGGGDTALTDALTLTRFASKIYLIHRREEFTAVQTLVDAVLKDRKIECIYNSVVTELIGDTVLDAIRIRNINTSEERKLDVTGLFVAIGIKPSSDLLYGKAAFDDKGYIITDSNMQTSISGVYAIGDVRNTPLRQVICAVNDGAIAATHACKI